MELFLSAKQYLVFVNILINWVRLLLYCLNMNDLNKPSDLKKTNKRPNFLNKETTKITAGSSRLRFILVRQVRDTTTQVWKNTIKTDHYPFWLKRLSGFSPGPWRLIREETTAQTKGIFRDNKALILWYKHARCWINKTKELYHALPLLHQYNRLCLSYLGFGFTLY